MCPVSNVRTARRRLEQYPVQRFFDRGLVVTIDTEDRSMFGSSRIDEYLPLAHAFAFTPDERAGLLSSARDASWLEPNPKAELRDRLQAGLATVPRPKSRENTPLTAGRAAKRRAVCGSPSSDR